MEFKVLLIKDNEKDILKFELYKDSFIIDLNSEEQDHLVELFYKLIELSFEEEIKFKLDYSAHDDDIFKDIADDYLKKLEIELKNVRANIPCELKSN